MNNSHEILLQRILHASVDVTPALACVGRWIAAHPVLAATQSAEEVARACGSSLAAVNRFAKHAGFDGFADLRLSLGKSLHQTLAAVTKLQAINASGEQFSTATQALAQAMDNLARASDRCDVQLLDRLAERICKARKLLFLGFGASSHVAAFGANVMQPYLPNVVNVADVGGTEQAMRRLADIGAGDVLIAISMPRYSRDAVVLAAYARAQGALVIAVTDSADSPLATESDYQLLAPSQHPVLPSSLVAVMAVVELLLARAVQRVPEAARRLAKLSESVLPYLTQGAETIPVAAASGRKVKSISSASLRKDFP